jgi:hypothetical protein
VFSFKAAPVLPIFNASIVQNLPQTACGFAMGSPRISELETALGIGGNYCFREKLRQTAGSHQGVLAQLIHVLGARGPPAYRA